MRYHGGKWRLAPWIISHFPPHRVYVEPFSGAASVLLRKPRSYAEVYNDLSGEVVNLFRVLRNASQARELIRQVRLTPYARDEFGLSYITADDPIEQARRTLFRAAAGFSTAGAQSTWRTGFRAKVDRSYTTPMIDWANMPQVLEQVVERLQGVVIENRPALEVVEQYDRDTALHYLDPPYPHSTRNERWVGQAYANELTDDDHRELARLVRTCKGAVVISGYPCSLYDNELYPDWQRVTLETYADQALKRTEALWIKPGTLSLGMLPLFAQVKCSK
jgi:DNA adenine methylase